MLCEYLWKNIIRFLCVIKIKFILWLLWLEKSAFSLAALLLKSWTLHLNVFLRLSCDHPFSCLFFWVVVVCVLPVAQKQAPSIRPVAHYRYSQLWRSDRLRHFQRLENEKRWEVMICFFSDSINIFLGQCCWKTSGTPFPPFLVISYCQLVWVCDQCLLSLRVYTIDSSERIDMTWNYIHSYL